MKKTHKNFILGLFFFLSFPLYAQSPTKTESTINNTSHQTHNSELITQNSDTQTSLSAYPIQDHDHFPYRDAKLTAVNPTDKPVAAVRLRWQQGGPAMQFPLSIAPGDTASRLVYLPAISPSQTYTIDLLPADTFTAAPIHQTKADIHWHVDLLTKYAFVDPVTWQECYTPPPPWGTATKITTLFVGIVIAIGFGAVLLVRRAGVRFWSWVGVTALSMMAVLIWWLVWGEPTLREIPLPNPFSEKPGFELQTRRTGEYTLPHLTPNFAPLYANQSDMETETLIVHPEKGAYLTLHSDETRIFLEQKERDTEQ